jgi:hypothetical protein
MEENVTILPGYKQEIPDTPRYVILHCSTVKIVWDWFVLIFILYTATSVPFIVCFKFDSLPMTVADTAVDVMFLIDIVLNFHTSFVGDDGAIVFDLRQIRRTYFRSWFFVDLVTSLPYGVIGMMITGGAGRVSHEHFLECLLNILIVVCVRTARKNIPNVVVQCWGRCLQSLVKLKELSFKRSDCCQSFACCLDTG